MKRIVVLGLTVLLNVGVLFAIDTIQFDIIGVFGNGNMDRQFSYRRNPAGGDSFFPIGLAVDKNGTIYSDDAGNNRIVSIGPGGSWNVLTEGHAQGKRLIVHNGLLFNLGDVGSYKIYDIEAQKIIQESRFNSVGSASYYAYTLVANDMLLIQAPPSQDNSSPRYLGFQFPLDFDGIITMLNTEQTIRFLKEDYHGTEDFSVDGNGYIFWDEKLVSPYGDSFSLFHWNTRSPVENWQKRADQGSFIGWDAEDNSYWNYANSIVVMTSNAELIVEMLAENVDASARSQFVVTAGGTLYVLSCSRQREEFELMKLDRFW